jgi:hypothetical protein
MTRPGTLRARRLNIERIIQKDRLALSDQWGAWLVTYWFKRGEFEAGLATVLTVGDYLTDARLAEVALGASCAKNKDFALCYIFGDNTRTFEYGREVSGR